MLKLVVRHERCFRAMTRTRHHIDVPKISCTVPVRHIIARGNALEQEASTRRTIRAAGPRHSTLFLAPKATAPWYTTSKININ